MRSFSVVSYDDLELSVEVIVDGVRYEYQLGDAYYGAKRRLWELRFAQGQQLNWLKRRGTLLR